MITNISSRRTRRLSQPVNVSQTDKHGSFDHDKALTCREDKHDKRARARDQSGKTKLARAKTRAKRPTKQPVDLIDDDHIDLAAASLQVKLRRVTKGAPLA
jgi:hypothetical protein